VAVDWRSLYPFTSRSVELDGHRYHYVDEGQGETLLLVHGNPTWSFYWRNLIRTLAPRYRLVAVDHMGCGLSDKPSGYRYQLDQHIDNLRRLVERLDLREVTLIAHDWGGPIGLGAALAAPERFARFVLMNTAAFRSQEIPWRIRVCRTPVLGRVAVQGFNAFARAAIRMAVCHHERMTAEVRAGFLAPYDSWPKREAIYRFVQDIPLSPGHPSYGALKNIESGLARLSAQPWLLLWGMRDWCFTPRFLERFKQFLPAAEAVTFADAGHYIMEDVHERIAPAIEDFVQRHSIARSSEDVVQPANIAGKRVI
jgi:pimeloyl-ACP methyl ester carboxylesterase